MTEDQKARFERLFQQTMNSTFPMRGHVNGLFFETLRHFITDIQQRRAAGRYSSGGVRGPDIGNAAFIPKGAKLKDFGFDMRPVKRPGVIAWAGLPNARARWNSNVGVFQGIIAHLESHNVQLSAPPLTPQPFYETATAQAERNLNPPLVCTLSDVLKVIHYIIDKVHQVRRGTATGRWFGENDAQPFMGNDNVTQLLVAEELATHLLACQLGEQYQVDPLVNVRGHGRVTSWQGLLTAKLVVRLARRSSCHCGGTARGGEVFGEFAELHVIGQDHQFLRDTIEWHDEVQKHLRATGAKWDMPENSPVVATIDPRCWFNQLAMFHYPDTDYFETGYLIRRWLRGDALRRHADLDQPCLCPRAASVEQRQGLVPALPSTIAELDEEAAWGEDLLAKGNVFPHGWELHRDKLSQWEVP